MERHIHANFTFYVACQKGVAGEKVLLCSKYSFFPCRPLIYQQYLILLLLSMPNALL